jgi:predicted nucleic acid-binding protein
MNQIIVMDAGPLGYATNPRASTINDQCRAWLDSLAQAGVQVVLPEIVDYEVRRGWLRTGNATAILRLNQFKVAARYLPISTEAMLLAAELWADARRLGYATAGDAALDADVILAAQAITLGGATVIATTNVSHLSRYTAAELWDQIR